MTKEEKRAKDRQYYWEHREERLANSRKHYDAEYKRKWLHNNPDKAAAYNARRAEKWNENNTEEFRAERRRKYAEIHKNDPMTEHRRACINAANRRMNIPLEERRERKMAKQAEMVAKEDIKNTYQQSEEDEFRNRKTVIKYIDNWSKRKTFTIADGKDGELMSEADVQAYCKEAIKYFELQKRLNETSPSDYGTRNIMSYKMRVIEEHFNTLLNRKYRTKCNLKQ